MLGNDHISQGATTHSSGGENSDRTSSTRKESRDHSSREHSRRSLSTVTPPARSRYTTSFLNYRLATNLSYLYISLCYVNIYLFCSSKKQQSTSYNNSRSGSLDRNLGTRNVMRPGFDLPYLNVSGVMPSQPIVQDPSMPLLTPPNPTTQLEEAKRRLEDESRSRILKSKYDI